MAEEEAVQVTEALASRVTLADLIEVELLTYLQHLIRLYKLDKIKTVKKMAGGFLSERVRESLRKISEYGNTGLYINF